MNPSLGQMLVRGATKRCPRCGGRGIFSTYFKLKERCPACGYRFQREEGAFTGALLMNWAFTLVLMIIPMFTYIFWRGIAGNDEMPFWPFAAATMFFAAFVPLVLYPLTVSSWAAVDLAMRPLDPHEVDDADAHAHQG